MTLLGSKTIFTARACAHAARTLLACALTAAVGCGGADSTEDDFADPGFTPAMEGGTTTTTTGVPGTTTGTSATTTGTTGTTATSGTTGTTATSGTTGTTTGTTGATTTAGTSAGTGSNASGGSFTDAGMNDTDGGIGLPGFDDLFPPSPDAGTGDNSDGGVEKDLSGPCADLKLFCIDPFDMFIFNPEACFTCNDGKGCQGCAPPYAY